MKVPAAQEEQFLTDAKGKRTGVLLNLDTYERLREAEEELADIQAYDAARPKVSADLKAGNFTTLADYRTKHNGKRK